MVVGSISELLLPTQAAAQTQAVAQTQVTNDLYYYNGFGERISLSVRKDAIAVEFKPETIGSGDKPLYSQLEEYLQEAEINVQVSPIGKNYALVSLPPGTSSSSVEVKKLIEQLDYVEVILPVYMRHDAPSESQQVLIPLNEIFISFQPLLSENQRDAILREEKLETIRRFRFTEDRYIVESKTASRNDVLPVANRLNEVKAVKSATPNFIIHSLSNQSGSENDSQKYCYTAKGERKNIEFDCPGVEAGFKYESLDNNFDDWYEAFVLYENWLEDGKSIFFAKFQDVGRFNLWDEQLSIGATAILDKDNKWAVAVEGTGTPNADFLPEWSVTGRVKYAFREDILGQFSFIREEFTITQVNKEQIKLEKTFGQFSQFQLSYRLELAQVLTAGDFTNHLVEAKYYYRYGSNVALQLFVGQIIEQEPIDAFRYDVVAGILLGKHLFNENWGVTYNLGIWDQDLGSTPRFTRVSGGLGIRYEF